MLRSSRTCPALLLLACALVFAACGSDARSPGAERGEDEAATAEPATLRFATFPSITRLQPAANVDAGGASIDLVAARGEREAGQLVAWATEGSPRVVIEPTSLRAKGGDRIAAKRVRAYLEQAMRVEQGSPASRSGTYVDPLLPARHRPVSLGDEQRLLAWIDVDVPVHANVGTYVGAVRIRRADAKGKAIGGDDGILARIPVRVRVREATIPKRPTLASHVGFDQSQLVRFEGVEAGSPELRALTERYAAELAAARLSIGDVGVLPPGTIPGQQSARGDADYLERVFDHRGVASVRIPFYLTYPFEDPLGRDRQRAVAYLRGAARWAREHGWQDRAYVFAFDEPSDADAGAVRELHELLRQADPHLRQLVTREASARAFQGSVDIWGPNITPNRYRRADVAREHRRGHETWWYPSITTWQPYPTLFIDELRPTPRALGWLAWQDGVDGILYWSATHWHEVANPYEDPASYNETDVIGNGDGVLLYPGAPIGLEGTPVPSVRLLQLRDGIEDHDLLAMATCAGSARDRATLRRAVRAAAPSLTQIDPTDAEVRALRAAAFGVIERTGAPARCREGG
jgi:hypothetical protein